MVHADVTVDQLLLMASIIQHLSQGFSVTLKIQKTCLKWLKKHRKRRKINKAKVLPVETTRARTCACVAKSAASENNACTCTCRICNLISAEKATFQREKCLVMLQKQWTMSSVCPSNSGCPWIVERAVLPFCPLRPRAPLFPLGPGEPGGPGGPEEHETPFD